MIPVVVTTIPERTETMARLRSELEQFDWADLLVYDEMGPDRKHIVPGAVRMAYDHDPAAPWFLYVEDDAWLSTEFGAIPRILVEATWTFPKTGIVNFFQTRDYEDGLIEWQGKNMLYAVCLAIRMPDPDEFEDFARDWYERRPQHQFACDFLLGHWARHKGERILIYTPSLVQHDIDKTTFASRKSIQTPRRSKSFRRHGLHTITPEP